MESTQGTTPAAPASLAVSGLVDSVTVKLNYPTEFDGVLRDTLTFRRPKVRDMRAAQKVAPGDEEAQELAIFATLAGVSPMDLEGLDLGDYHRVQDAYFRLTSARADGQQNAQGARKAAA
ncbi:phage tail assembly protein [Paraburkholderia bryophila]|uniref:phage tail assembly protein n=1 Tax=Paraburkholderia bryophila TaxID=420952 RepID=UPI0038BB5623